MCASAENAAILACWRQVIHRRGALFLVCILFFLVCKRRKDKLKQYDKSGPCYRFMVCCYRFTVTSLRIHGHLLQKYGAVHRDPLLLLQIYGPGLWGGSEALICYRFMVPAQVSLFCYKNMVLPVLLQI